MEAPLCHINDLEAACKAWVEQVEAAEDGGPRAPAFRSVFKIWSCKEAGYFGISGPAVTTDVDIVTFIANDGLEDPFFVPSTELVSNPKADIPIKPTAYGFYTYKKCGYISFYKDPSTGLWNIKSFKKNTDQHKQRLALKRPDRKATH